MSSFFSKSIMGPKELGNSNLALEIAKNLM
jgi:hypothetical protein